MPQLYGNQVLSFASLPRLSGMLIHIDYPDSFHLLDMNDCANHTCANGASCVDGVNSYSCNCPVGFTGTYCETGM